MKYDRAGGLPARTDGRYPGRKACNQSTGLHNLAPGGTDLRPASHARLLSAATYSVPVQTVPNFGKT